MLIAYKKCNGNSSNVAQAFKKLTCLDWRKQEVRKGSGPGSEHLNPESFDECEQNCLTLGLFHKLCPSSL